MKGELNKLLESFLAFSSGQEQEVGPLAFVLLLIFSLISSIFISYLYLYFYASRATGSHVHVSFPLLAVATTAIFLCIQFSLPLSLGLLGALSIVRFRTPIKEPEEIGFIMIVIASSLACATFNMSGLVAILGVSWIALVLRRFAPTLVQGAANDGSLVLSLPEEQYSQKSDELYAFIEDHLKSSKIESISKNAGEVVVTYSFKSLPSHGLVGLEAGLRGLIDAKYFTILYNRPGVI